MASSTRSKRASSRLIWSFDAGPHVYKLNGTSVLSVTDICDTVPVPYTVRSGEWGQVIHAGLLAFDLDAYHPDDFPPYVDPYVVTYRSFLTVHPCRWTHLEQPRVHPAGFGGTLDRKGRVDRLAAIVDFKSGAWADWHRLQTAGYDLLHDDLPPRIRRRHALYLSPRRFRFLTHSNPLDHAEFVQLARARGVRL